ncbi:MAG TPA: response regulator [Tepidisphaeraceae bacterium]|nr:response regulator [Tepidisphaeraceae bacterium]
MKKTGLMQHFADALAKSAGAMLDPNTASSCWSARFQLLTDTTSVRPISTRARCVLLIEDHESTARVISRQLARVGCVVRTVRGAGEARLALRESSDIDLILCDMSLPDGDPLELMSDLTKQYGLRGVALGAGSDNDMQSIRDSGFVERLAKPVDLVLLANVINRVVAMPRGEVESSR